MKYILSLFVSFFIVWCLATLKYVFELSAPGGFLFFAGWIGGMAFNYVFNLLKEKKTEP